MTDKKVVLITGVADYWGERLAARLAAEMNLHIIGLDVEPPQREIKRLDFIQADIRNPLLTELLREERVHTLCHLKFLESRRPTAEGFDLNVVGTMKVCGAAGQAGVQKVLLKSSTAVYGAYPSNPAFLSEDQPLRGNHHNGGIRDRIEMETFCHDFQRQATETIVTILRFANIVGPTVDTPMTRFLKQKLAPALLGFDPVMQFIHEDDVVEALAHAVRCDAPGVFNVAAPGALPLRRVMALAGKPPLAILHPLAYLGVRSLRQGAAETEQYAPLDLDYLRYPWVGDTGRMVDELGFIPRYSTGDALRAVANRTGSRRFRATMPAQDSDEARLRQTLERRRRARRAGDLPGGPTVSGDEE